MILIANKQNHIIHFSVFSLFNCTVARYHIGFCSIFSIRSDALFSRSMEMFFGKGEKINKWFLPFTLFQCQRWPPKIELELKLDSVAKNRLEIHLNVVQHEKNRHLIIHLRILIEFFVLNR